jgi:hypothetical protein
MNGSSMIESDPAKDVDQMVLQLQNYKACSWPQNAKEGIVEVNVV